jgi:hypothetical protein
MTALIGIIFAIIGWLTAALTDDYTQRGSPPLKFPPVTSGSSPDLTPILPPAEFSMATMTPIDARCGEWAPTARSVGWPEERLHILLDDIMWKESRCLPDVHNSHRDRGLLQVNISAHSRLLRDLNVDPDDLYDAKTNLDVGLQIAELADRYYGRWCQPWDPSGVRSC